MTHSNGTNPHDLYPCECGRKLASAESFSDHVHAAHPADMAFSWTPSPTPAIKGAQR